MVLSSANVAGDGSLWDDRVTKTAAIVPRVRAATDENVSNREDSEELEETNKAEDELESGESEGFCICLLLLLRVFGVMPAPTPFFVSRRIGRRRQRQLLGR